MDNNIVSIETIDQYNRLLGVETLNPLISIVDLSQIKPLPSMRIVVGFYLIFLKEQKCGQLLYGRNNYDYQEGTVISIGPGQLYGWTSEPNVPKARGCWALCFHPDLIRGTSLGRAIHEYTFFSYDVNEALHLSERERKVFVDCLLQIREEVEHSIDRMSRRLITKGLEMLLDYCLRFYERQFITRQNVNTDILTRFENLLHDYFDDPKRAHSGLPTVKYCANELCLSANYFGDLIKKETGRTAQEYIQGKIISLAKERVLDPTRTISQISYDLGFQYPQHFTRIFKKAVGLTPKEYRSQVG